jgi:ElaB/YqjD/DUF883 family membrane-anchored ribosome-binding protein
MVRDAKEMNPDEAVEAAKQKIRSSAKRVGEEMGLAVETAQSKLLETADGLQQRVTQTADGLQQRVTQTTEGLQERVTQTVGGLQERLTQTVDHTQDRVLKTVDHVQERVHDTADNLSQSVREAQGGLQDSAQQLGQQLQKPLELTRQKPLEAVAVAALAGWVLGMLTQGSAQPRQPKHRGGQQLQQRQSPQPVTTQQHESEPGPVNRPTEQARKFGQAPSTLTALAATGLGKMVWDAVREEYLTPQNVRGYIRSIFGSKPNAPK